MPKPFERNFEDYKKVERKALEIVATMKAVTPRKVDIELALLVAIFELHKGELPPDTVAAIIGGHLQQLIPFFKGESPEGD
jgi:hypothetical protein